MDGNTNPNTVDFSDVPALGDEQGLNNFLQNEQMAAQGITPVVEAPAQAAPAADPNAAVAGQQQAVAAPQVGQQQPAAPAQGQQAQPGLNLQGTAGSNLSQADLAAIAANVARINAGLGQRQVAPGMQQGQARPVTQPMAYSDQEKQFINAALAQGYSLDQINATILKRRSGAGMVPGANTAQQQQIDEIKQYLQNQEYQRAEQEFITRLSGFGNKFGLSEQDLVTFGNEALKKGINIAQPNVDLETVFRAVYPEQYRIRMQRMTPTNTSQIYGGTSIPEGNRVQQGKIEDAYVEQFLRGAMPNQFPKNK